MKIINRAKNEHTGSVTVELRWVLTSHLGNSLISVFLLKSLCKSSSGGSDFANPTWCLFPKYINAGTRSCFPLKWTFRFFFNWYATLKNNTYVFIFTYSCLYNPNPSLQLISIYYTLDCRNIEKWLIQAVWLLKETEVHSNSGETRYSSLNPSDTALFIATTLGSWLTVSMLPNHQERALTSLLFPIISLTLGSFLSPQPPMGWVLVTPC